MLKSIFNFPLLPYSIIFPSNELSLTFKILPFYDIPMAANADLPKERIDAPSPPQQLHLF